MEVSLARRLLVVERILEHEHGAVELVAQRLLHVEVLDELGERCERVAAFADFVAAVSAVLNLDVLE